MNLERRDIRKLRWSLLVAFALFASAAQLVAWSNAAAERSKGERDAAATRLAGSERRLHQLRSEAPALRASAMLFQQLEQSGLIGTASRLDWVDQLRQWQKALRLPGLSYGFGPPQALDDPVPAYGYRSTPAKIRLRLLHEEDLLNFIAALHRDRKTLIVVRACRLSRLPSATSPTGLQADCETEWISLRQKEGGQ